MYTCRQCLVMMTDPGFVDEEHKTVSLSGVFGFSSEETKRKISYLTIAYHILFEELK